LKVQGLRFELLKPHPSQGVSKGVLWDLWTTPFDKLRTGTLPFEKLRTRWRGNYLATYLNYGIGL